MVQDNLIGLHLYSTSPYYKKLMKIVYKNRIKMLNISRLICFTSKGKKWATIKNDITTHNKLKHFERFMRRKLYQIKSPKLINMSLRALHYGCRETVILKEIQIEWLVNFWFPIDELLQQFFFIKFLVNFFPITGSDTERIFCLSTNLRSRGMFSKYSASYRSR